MADKLLTALPEATTVALTDLLLMTVSGNSRKVQATNLGQALLALTGMSAAFATNVANLNALTTTGFFQISLTDAEAPTGNAPVGAACFCLNAVLGSNRIAQVALSVNAGEAYWRTKSSTGGGTWNPWLKIISTSSLQSSSTDVTAGSILTVGAFGLGANATSVANFDALTVTGYYQGGSSTVGIPVAGTGGWLLEHLNLGSGSAVQVAHRASSPLGQHFVRRRNSGTWGTWETQYSSGNILGTVSMASGLPTGAIVQYGANANGAFLKFASGDMICSTADRTVASVSTVDGALFKSADVNWTFPSAFIAPPVLSPAGVDDLDVMVATKLPVSTTVGVARLKSTVTKASTVTFGLVARGRWVA